MYSAFLAGYESRLNGAVRPEVSSKPTDIELLTCAGWDDAEKSHVLSSVKRTLNELGVADQTCDEATRMIVEAGTSARMLLLQAEVIGLRHLVAESAKRR